MTKRSRIFLGLMVIYAVGIAFLLYRVVIDIDPRYRESAEEALVETSQLMASLIEQDIAGGAIDIRRLDPLFRSAYARDFAAQIYRLRKTHVELRAYVTDRRGIVLFDSVDRSVGADYSQRLDVRRTLAGEYGARTTRDVAADPLSAVMYAAAPIRWQGEIVGVVSIGKPVRSFGQFVDDARARTLWVGVGSGLAALLLAVIVSVWLVRPFGLIADYVSWVRSQRRLSARLLAQRALTAFRSGFGEMRDALTGRNYVADYVQTFTHEVKSPLSAIRGATELLQEPAMPPEERAHFLANIAREAQRIQEIVDRMMELTALEARRMQQRSQVVALDELLRDIVSAAAAMAEARDIGLSLDLKAAPQCDGDPFLLRRAVSNLLDNAIDFSPPGSVVEVRLDVGRHMACITVRDHGAGIPEYALDKVFEKFYSLARPGGAKKSTGLGLAFVREIATLHRGRVTLVNAAGGGALATFTLPRLA